ncbi:MAG: hypothetical protein V1738_04040 [Patescibacteria group bacterium]
MSKESIGMVSRVLEAIARKQASKKVGHQELTMDLVEAALYDVWPEERPAKLNVAPENEPVVQLACDDSDLDWLYQYLEIDSPLSTPINVDWFKNCLSGNLTELTKKLLAERRPLTEELARELVDRLAQDSIQADCDPRGVGENAGRALSSWRGVGNNPAVTRLAIRRLIEHILRLCAIDQDTQLQQDFAARIWLLCSTVLNAKNVQPNDGEIEPFRDIFDGQKDQLFDALTGLLSKTDDGDNRIRLALALANIAVAGVKTDKIRAHLINLCRRKKLPTGITSAKIIQDLF